MYGSTPPPPPPGTLGRWATEWNKSLDQKDKPPVFTKTVYRSIFMKIQLKRQKDINGNKTNGLCCLFHCQFGVQGVIWMSDLVPCWKTWKWLHVVMFSLLAQLCYDQNDMFDYRSSTVLWKASKSEISYDGLCCHWKSLKDIELRLKTPTKKTFLPLSGNR